MSSTNRKQVLVMGLKEARERNPGQTDWTPDRVMESMAQQSEVAKKHGFDIESYLVDISIPQDALLDDIKTVLAQRPWDGVSVGYGVRGFEENTPLFEKIMNAVVETVQPTPKLMFALRPSSVWEAICRVFEVAGNAE